MLRKSRLTRYSTRRSILSLVCLFAIALILILAISTCGGDSKVKNKSAPDTTADSEWGTLVWGEGTFEASSTE